MNEYIAVFFTHSGAIRFDRKAKSSNIECQLMPVPRKLSSSCGICARFKFDKDVMELVDDEVEKIFIIKGGKYELVYSGD
ncbi:MAG TPA: DUF3343 domain-containing protein [Tissierellia bacterium]|mgnify:CR=1 FL=1|nr:DUF3343 domain-containing protein [Tissierellia bacterium]